jgi:predicted N-acetyltransferase YhbS
VDEGGFTIRALAASDSIDALTELLHAAYKVHADRGLRFVATHQDAATTRERAAEGECFVAEADGRVVGTITWRRGEPDSTCDWYREPGVAVFGQFAVDPALQGRGIGCALLVHCERRAAAQGFSEMACDTAGPAAEMIAVYERWGYRHVGRVRWSSVNYESVVLSKALSPG